MSENTRPFPSTGRWFPVPVKALFDLMKEKKCETVIVWLAMLSEAHLHPQWRTSSTIKTVAELTGLSPNTIQKCRRELIDAGLIRPVSGGGGTRKKIIFAVTRIANFNGKPGPSGQNGTPPKKPVGNWNLGEPERPRGDWES
jgi:hypothetical protein